VSIAHIRVAIDRRLWDGCRGPNHGETGLDLPGRVRPVVPPTAETCRCWRACARDARGAWREQRVLAGGFISLRAKPPGTMLGAMSL
jgi:hypothetical protein